MFSYPNPEAYASDASRVHVFVGGVMLHVYTYLHLFTLLTC